MVANIRFAQFGLFDWVMPLTGLERRWKVTIELIAQTSDSRSKKMLELVKGAT
jgi:hypothetical protein